MLTATQASASFASPLTQHSPPKTTRRRSLSNRGVATINEPARRVGVLCVCSRVGNLAVMTDLTERVPRGAAPAGAPRPSKIWCASSRCGRTRARRDEVHHNAGKVASDCCGRPVSRTSRSCEGGTSDVATTYRPARPSYCSTHATYAQKAMPHSQFTAFQTGRRAALTAVRRRQGGHRHHLARSAPAGGAIRRSA